MQKTALIALAIIGTLTAGFFLLNSQKAPQTDSASDLKNIYNQWKVNYKINVGSSEDNYRFNVFAANYEKITLHNKIPGRSFDMGLNAFAHLTAEEFAATHFGLNMPADAHATKKNISPLPTDNLPKSVNWTSKMNYVKSQEQCGSCWIFTVTGAIEGLYSVLKGELYDLSGQELIDCSGDYGNQGCNGGLIETSFNYTRDKGGLSLESAYPYTASDGQCKTGLSRYAKISSFTSLPANDANALKAAIAQQPVSVIIEADQLIFQLYQSGIINDEKCGTQIDHSAVAVGYNTEGPIPFYIVRNSWGASWGEQGYVRIAMTGDGPGICGIQMQSVYPNF